MFAEVTGHVLTLAQCPNGHKVLCKCIELVQWAGQSVASKLVERVDAMSLACHVFGCSVFQKLLEHHQSSEGVRFMLKQLIGEQMGHVLTLVQCPNGHKVILKCIELVQGAGQSVASALMETVDAMSLACHVFGCCVFHKLLEQHQSSEGVQFMFKQLIGEQRGHALILVQCPSGHKVLLKCIELVQGAGQSVASELMETVDAMRLACHVFGCRVFQKLLECHQSSEAVQSMYEQLIGHARTLVKCPHGNHVLQQCIKSVPGAAQRVTRELASLGSGSAKRLACNEYGCRIFQRLLEEQETSEAEELVRLLINDTRDNAGELCLHKFAKYVMHHLFLHGISVQGSGLFHAVLELAQHVLQESSPVADWANDRHAYQVVLGLLQCPNVKQQTQLLLTSSNGTWRTGRYGKKVAKAADLPQGA